MANNLIIMMDMVCSLVLQAHGSGKLHNHYSFVVVANGQRNCYHIEAKKVTTPLCKHVSSYVTL
jgi:hypothetical protein